jgi:hypothetical protein
MVTVKSSDEYKLIAALLLDVQTSYSEVFDRRALRLTTQKVGKRMQEEGIGFLTKTLPRLGKAFDRALLGVVPFDSSLHRFKTMQGSELPRFLGEFFKRVFSHDGRVLLVPCNDSIKVLRQLLYLFYKYELPYSPDQEREVIDRFIKTEQDLDVLTRRFERDALSFEPITVGLVPNTNSVENNRIVRRARTRLSRVFASFDPLDIYPRHGPGAVSTRERLSEKYRWRVISPRIVTTYPLDTYFYASIGHVCDQYKDIQKDVSFDESFARVVLVPKDSRGPRLISEEPLDFQWIQQGLSKAMVRHVEAHPLTRKSVHFTDQQPNRLAALLGSIDGELCTLDLNEASDRVHSGLVRLLFPEPLLSALMNCRSLGTTLPDGRQLLLQKYAPMGSALCFPVLALTVWSLLTAGCTDANLRKKILVYGDDVVVPKAYASDAMQLLESFGLKINRDKSCTSGFFRESCGLDAYRGIEVTPVRFRTVWSSIPSPESYTSWIAYANSMYKRKYFDTYDVIVGMLTSLYGTIPSVDMNLSCPSLEAVPDKWLPKKRRNNKSLQKLQYYVRDVRSQSVSKTIDGWFMLLRFFSEGCSNYESSRQNKPTDVGPRELYRVPFSVRRYTKRHSSKLEWCWR